MKCFFKKLVSTAFIALLTIENMGFYVDAAVRYKAILDEYFLTASSESVYKERINRMIEILKLEDNSFNGKAIILDCGMYCNVFHNGIIREYESHHLISNCFCENHSGVITSNEAPAVLIPAYVHQKTGSYGKHEDDEYFKKEKECFEKGGLKAVLKLGIEDLKNALKESGVEFGNLLDLNSPIVVKLNSYVDFFDSRLQARKTRSAQDFAKAQFISSFCIFTPLKPKTKREINRQSDNFGRVRQSRLVISGKRKRNDEVISNLIKKAHTN